MKITIDIPKEFEQHFSNDRFKDSLERLKVDAGTFCMAGRYEIELCEMLQQAFKNAEVVNYAENEKERNNTKQQFNYNRVKYEKPKLYLCDTNKNLQCRATACFKNGGCCELTHRKEFALTDENGNAIEYKEDE